MAYNDNISRPNDEGPIRRPEKHWLNRMARLDDGLLMTWAFRLLLVLVVVTVGLDYREIRQAEATLAPFDPTLPDTDPILPPALTDGEAPPPPAPVLTAPEILRQPIEFVLEPGGILRATGSIDPAASARFAGKIEVLGEYVDTVELDSPGGSVDDAILIGEIIRQEGINTVVRKGALCASSCPLVLAGGLKRDVEDGAVVGIHQVFSVGDEIPSPAHAMSEAQKTTARINHHLVAMDIDTSLWVHALETPPDRLYYLSLEELKSFRVIGKSEVASSQ